MLIIGSYHKTGSLLWTNIWRDYFQGNMKNVKDFNHFDIVSDDVIKKTKCLVLIRHPKEIIMSGVRYHQITDEKWCVEKHPDKYGGLSYREYIQSLTEDDKITFEMENYGGNTINSIYNDMKTRNYRNNVMFIRIEDLYNKKNIPSICQKIKRHCHPSVDINAKKLTNSFIKMLAKSFHRTHKTNTHTYSEHFKDTHINRFADLFPSDLLDVMGYSS